MKALCQDDVQNFSMWMLKAQLFTMKNDDALFQKLGQSAQIVHSFLKSARKNPSW